jgi:hypothetical protein
MNRLLAILFLKRTVVNSIFRSFLENLKNTRVLRGQAIDIIKHNHWHFANSLYQAVVSSNYE